MKLDRKTRWSLIIIIAVLAVVMATFIYLNSHGLGIGGVSDFTQNLQNANEIALIMDTRGSPSKDADYNIMVCGIGLSGSRGLVGKDITIYGIEDAGCIISYPNATHDDSATIEKCENDIKNKLQIYIQYGEDDKTVFTANKMNLFVSENFNSTCAIDLTYS